jgi:N-acetylglucosaminyl-diphospho-decaprenol L-rhamnosyltransferase
MISVIIVTFNSSEQIAKCLASLEANRGSSIGEIIVVDNASFDGTAERIRQQFPGVKLIAAQRNLGFAAASNLGASQASGAALLFLNPDAELHSPVAELERAMESAPDVVAAAPRLVDEQGQTQVGFNVRRLPHAMDLIFEILLLNRLFPNNPLNRRYRCLDLDHARPAEVEQPAGACLLVRRSSFERCRGFDEQFFPLWFEDVDLCLRLRRDACGGEAKATGRILFCPQVQVVHSGGHSLESITFSERQVYWYRNLLYYVHKHFPWTTGIAVRAALLCGMALRLAAELPGLLTSLPARTPTRGQRVCAYWKAAKLSFQGWK